VWKVRDIRQEVAESRFQLVHAIVQRRNPFSDFPYLLLPLCRIGAFFAQLGNRLAFLVPALLELLGFRDGGAPLSVERPELLYVQNEAARRKTSGGRLQVVAEKL
jgi:hypothetical protein